jgi:hypothetical protein
VFHQYLSAIANQYLHEISLGNSEELHRMLD